MFCWGRFRLARQVDLPVIRSLLAPEIRQGNIMPIDNLVNELPRITVIENGLGRVIGCGMRINYDDWVELGKIVVSPNYRSQGWTTRLLEHLVEKSRTDRFNGVFGLTIDDRMANIFQKVGLRPHSRELLPESWQLQYDWTRLSKCFVKKF